jgi:hypothetical protein
MTQTHQTAPVSPWAPFRHRAFFWLWLGVVVSSVGSWAQTVGAQWLFVHDPNAATIVSVNVNVARAAGPALAGLMIAQWGVPPVFALTAVSGAFLAVVLMRWRRPRVSRGEREPFLRLWWPVGATCVTSPWFKGSCFAWPPSWCPRARCGRCCL